MHGTSPGRAHMSVRHLLVAVAVAVFLVAGLGTTAATPAHAASADPASSTLACASDTDGANDRTITGAVGDTFTLQSNSGVHGCGLSPTAVTFGATTYTGYSGIVTAAGLIVFGSGPVEYFQSAGATFTIVGSGSFTLSHGNLDFRNHSSTITVRLPGAPVTTPAPAIPAWVQAYGRDKDAACLDGWGASWQQWAEKVTGGWVCDRSIPSLG